MTAIVLNAHQESKRDEAIHPKADIYRANRDTAWYVFVRLSRPQNTIVLRDTLFNILLAGRNTTICLILDPCR